jgi:hypothetical protein
MPVALPDLISGRPAPCSADAFERPACRVVARRAAPRRATCRLAERRAKRTRMMNPSGFSCSPVSGSPVVSLCRKKPRCRTRGSLASIFKPPLSLRGLSYSNYRRQTPRVTATPLRVKQNITVEAWSCVSVFDDRRCDTSHPSERDGDAQAPRVRWRRCVPVRRRSRALTVDGRCERDGPCVRLIASDASTGAAPHEHTGPARKSSFAS